MNSPLATSAVVEICTSIGTAISRVTPCSVRRPTTMARRPAASTRTLWKVTVGKRSTSKKSELRRCLSRISMPVSSEAASMVRLMRALVRAAGSTTTSPLKRENRPSAFINREVARKAISLASGWMRKRSGCAAAVGGRTSAATRASAATTQRPVRDGRSTALSIAHPSGRGPAQIRPGPGTRWCRLAPDHVCRGNRRRSPPVRARHRHGPRCPERGARAPPPEAPGSPPPAPPRRRLDLEQRIGARWATWVGIVAILVAVALFLKWAFENAYLGPAARVGLGLVAGLVMLGGGLLLHRRRDVPYLSEGLAGGGLGVLYLSLFAAHALYGLVGPTPAFVAMFAVTLLGTAVAVVSSRLISAVLAVLGGLLTPVLLQVDRAD